ncbi:MAG: lipoyl synthase [Holosporales bacterium]|jgi:lipoic acid synthetase|nr:lipoyl synthase [Holosporales bacterium]
MSGSPQLKKRPDWLKVKLARTDAFEDTLNVIKGREIYTVCEEALCPNIGECWRNKTATFLIMGNVCTRRCGFCNIKVGTPQALDKSEPEKVAHVISELEIKYAVITSVTRDDLPDGGATHFARVIKHIRMFDKTIEVEILTPDFKCDENAMKIVADAKPDVFGHNLEIVKRLHHEIKRPPASYDASLSLLKRIKAIDATIVTKTGVMVGIGETREDILGLIEDVAAAKIDILTIGQYLTPTTSHYPIVKYVTPDEFEEYREYGEQIGIKKVISGPLVRSSYRAREVYSSLCHLD